MSFPLPRSTTSQRYRVAAEEFTARARAVLGDRLDAVVLYGSAARGEAKRDSDVDILILSDNIVSIRHAVYDIAEDVMLEGNYTACLSFFFTTPAEASDHLRRGSPFLDNVLFEGIPLYDNGSFAGLRSQTAPARS